MASFSYFHDKPSLWKSFIFIFSEVSPPKMMFQILASQHHCAHALLDLPSLKNNPQGFQVLAVTTRGFSLQGGPISVVNGFITPISRFFSPQLPIYKAIYRAYNSIYNDSRGPPCSDLRYSFALSDGCFSSDLLVQAEYKGVAQLRTLEQATKRRKDLLRNWGLLCVYAIIYQYHSIPSY